MTGLRETFQQDLGRVLIDNGRANMAARQATIERIERDLEREDELTMVGNAVVNFIFATEHRGWALDALLGRIRGYILGMD